MALLLATRTLRAWEVGRGCFHTHTTGEVRVQIFDPLKMISSSLLLLFVHIEPGKRAEGAIIHILQVRLNTIGKDAVLVKIINSYPIVLDTCLSRRILNWSPKGDESDL